MRQVYARFEEKRDFRPKDYPILGSGERKFLFNYQQE
jgi:hypothetical protein